MIIIAIVDFPKFNAMGRCPQIECPIVEQMSHLAQRLKFHKWVVHLGVNIHGEENYQTYKNIELSILGRHPD